MKIIDRIVIEAIIVRTPTSLLVQMICGLCFDADRSWICAIAWNGETSTKVLLAERQALTTAHKELNRRLPRSESWDTFDVGLLKNSL